MRMGGQNRQNRQTKQNMQARQLFFFASAGPKEGPVCSDRSRTLRGFTAWFINNQNPRCSISGNTRYLAVKRSVVHPYHGV